MLPIRFIVWISEQIKLHCGFAQKKHTRVVLRPMQLHGDQKNSQKYNQTTKQTTKQTAKQPSSRNNDQRKHQNLFTPSSLPMLALMISFCLGGCASSETISHTTAHSLNFIRYILNQTAPRGIRSASSNGRELDSNYFNPKIGFYAEGAESRERAYAHFTILGDRRPYTTKVRVYRQKKSGGRYDDDGTDANLTEKLASQIRDALAKSPEGRSIIDDFRVF